MSGPFERWTDADIVELVDRYPFAWLVSAAGDFVATPLPILLETDAQGRPRSLVGHIPRANPHVPVLRAQPRTLFLFTGPQGYLSPELVPERSWAPTWNFGVARIVADVAFDEALADEALSMLVERMERGRARPWSVEEMGPRYEQLRERIVAFRAPIRSISARFKLGQDERPHMLEAIVEGLEDQELADWMRRFNGDRL